MRVLLSDGSGLTARQTAAQLADAGHPVEVLSPDPLCLARFTRRVRHVWRVPPYGPDPLRWLRAAVSAYQSTGADVLVPTQEQVAVLSACNDLVRAAGVRTAVPSFAALSQVQDKLSAFAMLTDAGLPQPEGAILATPTEVAAWDRFPVFMKLPIGTATTGVRRIRDRAQLAGVVSAAKAAGAFGDGGVLAQLPAAGPLVMVQAAGASHKRSVLLPAVREHLDALGRRLRWHGALSADAILTGRGPLYIDINPRLVEPANALRSGVDLVTPLIELASGATPQAQPPGGPGVATHQLLLAVLGAAQRTGRRWPVIAELAAAARHAGDYRGSTEELTPVRRDLRAATPVVMSVAATVIRPASWRWFTSGSVASYSLSPAGWRQLRGYRSQRTAG